jgi:hypothetical protein
LQNQFTSEAKKDVKAFAALVEKALGLNNAKNGEKQAPTKLVFVELSPNVLGVFVERSGKFELYTFRAEGAQLIPTRINAPQSEKLKAALIQAAPNSSISVKPVNGILEPGNSKESERPINLVRSNLPAPVRTGSVPGRTATSADLTRTERPSRVQISPAVLKLIAAAMPQQGTLAQVNPSLQNLKKSGFLPSVPRAQFSSPRLPSLQNVRETLTGARTLIPGRVYSPRIQALIALTKPGASGNPLTGALINGAGLRASSSREAGSLSSGNANVRGLLARLGVTNLDRPISSRSAVPAVQNRVDVRSLGGLILYRGDKSKLPGATILSSFSGRLILDAGAGKKIVIDLSKAGA